MLRTGAIVAGIWLLLLAAGCGEKETTPLPTEAPYLTTLEAAMEAVGTSDKLIVIKFYTDWCTWCKTLDTVTLVDTTVIDLFMKEMVLVKINAEVDSLLAQQYSVQGFPTMVMVRKDGTEIDRAVGYLEPAELLETLRNYRQGIGTMDDLLNKVATEPTRQLYFDIAQKHEYRGGDSAATIWYRKVVDDSAATLDSLTGQSRMSLAGLLRQEKNFVEAIAAYQAIARDFAGQQLAAEAEVWTCIAHRQKGDTAAAIACFEGFVTAHPESEEVEYCQEQIAKLKGEPTPESH